MNPNFPQHVALIMDGNGRWAAERGLERVFGHEQGAKTVESITEHALKVGIKFLTLYAFSSENWQRPHQETTALMHLLSQFLFSKVKKMQGNGIRLNAIGDLARLPEHVQSELKETMHLTANGRDMMLTLALSYGGRDELVRAAKALMRDACTGQIKPEQLTEPLLNTYLDTKNMPDVDLIIRTSGECRISNFMLWQAAYAELMFVETYWPDFSCNEFDVCLENFGKRKRRFGLTGAQIEGQS